MKTVVAAVFLCLLLIGCGGEDDGAENCRWIRFVPEHGESYYRYTCDNHRDLVRAETEDIAKE